MHHGKVGSHDVHFYRLGVGGAEERTTRKTDGTSLTLKSLCVNTRTFTLTTALWHVHFKAVIAKKKNQNFSTPDILFCPELNFYTVAKVTKRLFVDAQQVGQQVSPVCKS